MDSDEWKKKKKKKGDTFWNIERISYIRRIFVNSSDLIFYHVFFFMSVSVHFWPDKGDAIYVELLPFLPERKF